jgi:lipoprotein NlpD
MSVLRDRARPRAFATLLLIAVLSSACSPPFVATEGLTYVVQPGDSLYAIAWRYDLDYRDVAGWNHLGPDYRIAVGQVLKLSADGAVRAQAAAQRPRQSTSAARTAAASAEAAVLWQWPAAGKIVGPVRQPMGGFGLRIIGSLGDPVRAAAAGRVVYSGTALRNYGHLVIVKHSNSLLSAYGHNQAVLVSEGQQVSKGQSIAEMGMGPGQQPTLYFEIRHDGKPVDPSRYLPQPSR